MVKAGFKLLKPTMDLSTNLNLWWNLWNDKYVEGFTALNKWANEYVAFPGEFFRQWVRDFYQGNKLFRGELVFGGRPVRLGEIRCPVFVVGAKEDYIAPPACVRALIDAVGSREKDYTELPGGHISLIAGRGPALHCWPKVSGWLAPHSLANAHDGRVGGDEPGVRHVAQAARGVHPGVDAAGEPGAGAAPRSDGLLAPGAQPGAGAVGADVRADARQSRSRDAVEAVPRPVDRGMVAGAGAGDEHRGVRAAHGAFAGGLAHRPGTIQEGGRAGAGAGRHDAQPGLAVPAHRGGEADRRAGGATRARGGWSAGDPPAPGPQGARMIGKTIADL